MQERKRSEMLKLEESSLSLSVLLLLLCVCVRLPDMLSLDLAAHSGERRMEEDWQFKALGTRGGREASEAGYKGGERGCHCHDDDRGGCQETKDFN